jgi:hypothetical protein
LRTPIARINAIRSRDTRNGSKLSILQKCRHFRQNSVPDVPQASTITGYGLFARANDPRSWEIRNRFRDFAISRFRERQNSIRFIRLTFNGGSLIKLQFVHRAFVNEQIKHEAPNRYLLPAFLSPPPPPPARAPAARRIFEQTIYLCAK